MTVSRLFSVTLAACALAAPQMARAQVVDQQQTSTAGGAFTWVTGSFQGEVFTPTFTNVSGGGFFLTAIGNPIPLTATIRLFDTSNFVCDPSPPGCNSTFHGYYDSFGAALASADVTVNSGTHWYDAFFSTPVAVTPGHSYMLQITSSAPFDFNNNYQTTVGDYSYPGVRCYGGTAPGTQQACSDGPDFAFREYYTAPTQSTTPEPSAIALLGTGIVGLIPAFRRRRL